MANPTVTINYSNKVVLTVEGVDNRLIGIMAPDTPGTGGKRTQVFAYECDGFPGNAGATIDLTSTLGSVGGSPILAMIGSNFTGGGGINFKLVPDGDDSKAQSINANLPAFSSEQWSFKFVKQ